MQKKKAKKSFLYYVNCVLVGILVLYALAGGFALIKGRQLLAGKPNLNLDDLNSSESTKIYDANNKLITEVGSYYRENISYKDMPQSLVDAFLSVEDSRFFAHNGFDVPRFTKSVLETLIHHNVQGGSTFTMQLVKNTYFSTEDKERKATLSYKAQQIVLATELEKKMSKEKIFELYLNKLNFGNRIRGVQKASQYYFSKDAKNLSLSESALLAGIINLPNRYNPYRYLEYATSRRNEVLDLMEYHGYISANEKKLAKSIKVENLLKGNTHLRTESSQYSSFVDAVLNEAQELTGKDPVSSGMEIHTTLVPQIQEQIEKIQNEKFFRFPDKNMQISLVSINNKNGEIVGIGGGRHYGGSARLLNRAVSSYKQPGSSIKPIVDYAPAFEYLGYSTDEMLLDQPMTFPSESRVLHNAGNETKYRGDVDIKTALAHSLNIPAIRSFEAVTAKIGSDKYVEYLRSLGFKKARYGNFHPSIAIGGNLFTTTVTEVAGAHAAIVNLGKYNQPHTIRKIVYNGKEYLPPNQNKQVISSGSAYLTDVLMANNVTSGVYNYMQVLKRSYPIYAKTGTTDWGSSGLSYGIPKGAAKDSWMVASSSNYTNAVWLGYDSAKKGEGTYLHNWKRALNLPGRINNLMLDVEEKIPGVQLNGVQKPEDVVNIRYSKGTYPHIAIDRQNIRNPITSMVSKKGLENVPTVYAGDYQNNANHLAFFHASISNGLIYANWGAQNVCSGYRDISLHDRYNNISKSGSCLASNGWLPSLKNAQFYMDLYQDDKYITTIQSKKNTWEGLPAYFKGTVKACGWMVNNGKKSEKICTSAGYYSPEDTQKKDKALNNATK
ncbi:transglycosylase domain-containing protein [Bulleidia sp. zg-1006]|uniref:transglycosylase domain-containing protein n=1 Tax=Bulleidia sp. zg-1006 TaxID=2806552 RepID=UPI00193A7D84|nr:transglycosylase domain-containing protein [Bulleidia sp. zg-1006]QRG86014.1 penicillin-binding protein [Bulleidia sp. zg-1006]